MLQPRLLFLLSSLLTWSSLSSPATALPQELPAGADLKEDNGQVTINPDSTANQTAVHPRATIFSGVPGPTHCRGHAVLLLDLPPPALNPDNNTPITTTTTPQCYNIPNDDSTSTAGTAAAGCGTFLANKSDGCEARMFAEPNCVGYLNTVVFIPEDRAVGGQWRSME
ncbi:hypothetical protein N0V85_008096, partial [Neurospora sp. IMI 360204]